MLTLKTHAVYLTLFRFAGERTKYLSLKTELGKLNHSTYKYIVLKKRNHEIRENYQYLVKQEQKPFEKFRNV